MPDSNEQRSSNSPKNYYDVIVEKIKTKILENSKEALFLVEKELNAPYIPKEYENIFRELLLKAIQNYENNRAQIKLSPSECLEILISKNRRLKPLALAELRNYALRPFINEINQLFQKEEIEIQIKASIYEFLCEQDINFEFKIGKESLNPVKNKSLVNNSFYLLNRNKINEKTFKDVSITNVALEILNSYCATVFPEAILIGEKDYSTEFIYIAKKLLGIEKDEEKTPLCDIIYSRIFSNNS
ncbi:hypothetical protein [[Mycoplasma] mobile]|uniref:Expressed protein n=1 Tax=Mycoplasma mobile (strain ATCC 43663 / 163K / NCTC 11711) TaxID=267748 RepID=Q6KIK6_MYCM1|nr:hypothetical protein [[Mycoplasma] mobile]AAT27570.1 expressed protein [Mycoplasma mobile 163K]